MSRTIWEEVPASEVTKGDVLQWGLDPQSRVRVTDTYDTDPTRIHDGNGNPARTVQVTGPTDRFEGRLAGQRTSATYRPDMLVKRMRPEHAAKVADTNLRTVYDDPNERQDAEIRALEARQAHYGAQIEGATRDRGQDVRDPILAYEDVARQLAPHYAARKQRLGMPSDAETAAKADLSMFEEMVDLSTPETARETLRQAASCARETALALTEEAAMWQRKGDFVASSSHTAHLAPVFRQQGERAATDAEVVAGTASAWEQQAAAIS